MAIPRSPADWSAIVPNETDRKIAESWMDSTEYCAAFAAAASRLHEQERGVAALAVHLFDGSESMSYFVSEARRILGCEPESPDAYFRADYASNRREARRGLVGEPESGESGASG